MKSFVQNRIFSIVLVLCLVAAGSVSTVNADTYGYFKEPEYEYPGEFSEGLASYTTHVGNEMFSGYIDKTGEFVIKPQFRKAESFSDGLAAVSIYDKSKGKELYGYIDKTGAYVIKPQFYAVTAFSEGLAFVGQQGYYDTAFGQSYLTKYKLIDKKGKYIVQTEFETVSEFDEGVAVVGTFSGNKLLYGLINKTGKYIVKPMYDSIYLFSEGLAKVKLNGRVGYINTSGKAVIKPAYEDGLAFSEGLAAVKTNGKWGFIDSKGKMVIKAQYSDALSITEGLAAVDVNQKTGYIDKTGKFIIQPQLDKGLEFSEGLAAAWQNGKWGYIDKTGKFVIPAQFGGAEKFKGGTAVVEVSFFKNNLIDKAGKILLEDNLYYIGEFKDGFALVRDIPDGRNGFITKLSSNDSPAVSNKLLDDYLKTNGLKKIKSRTADYNNDKIPDYVLLAFAANNEDNVSIHIVDGANGKCIVAQKVKNGFESEDFELKNIVGDEKMEILYTSRDGGQGVGPDEAIYAFDQGKLIDAYKLAPAIPSAEYSFHAMTLNVYFEQLNKTYSMKLDDEDNLVFMDNAYEGNDLKGEEIGKTIVNSDTPGMLKVIHYVEYGFAGGNEVYSLNCTYKWENNSWKLLDVVMNNLMGKSPVKVINEINPAEAANWYKGNELTIDKNNIGKLFAISKGHLPKVLKKQVETSGDFDEYAGDGSVTFIYAGDSAGASAIDISGKDVNLMGARVGMSVNDLKKVLGKPASNEYVETMGCTVYIYKIEGYNVSFFIFNNSVDFFRLSPQ